MPSRDTSTAAKHTEHKLGLHLIAVAALAGITFLSYCLSEWRKTDEHLNSVGAAETQDLVDAVTVFTTFPDWSIAHALASYGGFVADHWIGVVEVLAVALVLTIVVKAVRAIQW